jgi:hypothetical protein
MHRRKRRDHPNYPAQPEGSDIMPGVRRKVKTRKAEWSEGHIWQLWCGWPFFGGPGFGDRSDPDVYEAMRQAWLTSPRLRQLVHELDAERTQNGRAHPIWALEEFGGV